MGNTCCTISPVIQSSMNRNKRQTYEPKDVKKFIANTDLAIGPYETWRTYLSREVRTYVSRILPDKMV